MDTDKRCRLDKRQILNKYFIPYILVLCIALLTEVFIFNVRCFESLFYEEKMLGDFESWIDNDSEEGVSSLFINIGGYKIHNLYIDFSIEDKASKIMEAGQVGIAVQDQLLFDGDYLLRPITERMVIDSVTDSKYIFFTTYGNTDIIRINFPKQEGKACILREIKLNAHRPMLFSWGRFLLVLFFGLGICAFRPSSLLWEKRVSNPGKNGCVILFIGYIVLFILTSWWVFQNPLNFPGGSDDFMPYAELARALESGKVYVGVQDPASGITGNELSIWHENVKGVMFDHALFEGKYYICYGILPCILFYLPWHIVSGSDLPDVIAQLIQFMVLLPVIHLLLLEIESRFFKKSTIAAHLLVMCAMLTGSSLPCVLIGARVYCVAIMCGVNSALLGILFWLKAEKCDGKKKMLFLFLGSSFMASTALSRPPLLLFSIIALPIFWRDLPGIKKGVRLSESFFKISAFFVPYVIFAIVTMYYNVIRFRDPFEFGIQYNMTVAPAMRTSVYLPETVLMCIYEFFLKLPVIETKYPFLINNFGETRVMYSGSWYFFETVGYGLLIMNPFLWILINGWNKEILTQNKRVISTFFICMGLSIFLLIYAVSQTQTVAARYLFEGSFSYFFAASFLWMHKMEGEDNEVAVRRIRLKMLLLVWIPAFLQLLPQLAGARYPLEEGNQNMFYHLLYDFQWF